MPRSVEIPYSKEMHKLMSKAQDMLGHGQQVHMGKAGVEGEGAKPGEGEAKGRPGGRNGQSTYHSQAPFDFIPPPDTLAPKD